LSNVWLFHGKLLDFIVSSGLAGSLPQSQSISLGRFVCQLSGCFATV